MRVFDGQFRIAKLLRGFQSSSNVFAFQIQHSTVWNRNMLFVNRIRLHTLETFQKYSKILNSTISVHLLPRKILKTRKFLKDAFSGKNVFMLQLIFAHKVHKTFLLFLWMYAREREMRECWFIIAMPLEVVLILFDWLTWHAFSLESSWMFQNIYSQQLRRKVAKIRKHFEAHKLSAWCIESEKSVRNILTHSYNNLDPCWYANRLTVLRSPYPAPLSQISARTLFCIIFRSDVQQTLSSSVRFSNTLELFFPVENFACVLKEAKKKQKERRKQKQQEIASTTAKFYQFDACIKCVILS